MLADTSVNSYRNGYSDIYSINTVSQNSSNLNLQNGSVPGQIDEDLYEFLKEADLPDYTEQLHQKLKVRSVAHLKYVDDTDLQSIGMSRPEIRRLKKFFEKHCPQTAMGKIKKKLSRNASTRSTSVPRPIDPCGNRANSYCYRGGRGFDGGQMLASTSGLDNTSQITRLSSVTVLGYKPGSPNSNIIDQNGSVLSPGSDDQTTIGSITNFSIASSTITPSADCNSSMNSSCNTTSSATATNACDRQCYSRSSSIVVQTGMDLHYAKATGNQHLITSKSFNLEEILANSSFAQVYKARLTTTTPPTVVAIKTIEKASVSGDINDFIKDIFVLCCLNNDNIAKIFGLNLDGEHIKIITELAPLGNLMDNLGKTTSKSQFPVPILHSFIVQISQAMAYLEDHSIVHGNLIGSNVLLFDNYRVKLIDVGLYHIQPDLSHQTPSTLTRNRPLCPPELMRATSLSKRTIAGDVWTFGWLAWQIFSYALPLPNQRHGNPTNTSSSNNDTTIFMISQPELCPTMIYQLLLNCWAQELSSRPSFFQLSTQIIRIQPEKLVALTNGPDSPPNNNNNNAAINKADNASDSSYSSLPDTQMLNYSKDDVIVVLDRRMNQYRDYWKGCKLDGEVGLFKWANMRADSIHVANSYNNQMTTSVMSKTSTLSTINGSKSPNVAVRAQSLSRGVGDALSKLRISRRETENHHKSSMPTTTTTTANKHRGRLSIDMISGPSNDFRHVGHVGHKGDVFGDVTTLYTTTAQQHIKSGTLTVNSKINRNNNNNSSVDNLSMSSNSQLSSAVNTTMSKGDDTPPYATIEAHISEGNTAKYSRTEYRSSESPPMLPQRCPVEGIQLSNHSEEFSLFDEMARQWDLHSKDLDSPSSQMDKSLEITPTPNSQSQSVNYIPELPQPDIPNEINSTSNTFQPTKIQSISLPQQEKPAEPILEKPVIKPKPVIPMKTSGGFLSKFIPRKHPHSTNSANSNSTASPVYAKIQKPKISKPSKDKKISSASASSDQSKKNIISGPVLISGPIPIEEHKEMHPISITTTEGDNDNNSAVTGQQIDESYLDCTSEVSSLQPSPKESLLALNKFQSSSSSSSPTSSQESESQVTQRPNLSYRSQQYQSAMASAPVSGSLSFNCRQNNPTVTAVSKHSGSSTATTISPASSLGSIAMPTTTNFIQSGPPLRALKKTDGVFRAAGSNSGRRRPSASAVNDQYNSEQYATLNRSLRKTSVPNTIPLKQPINGSTTIDRLYANRYKSNTTCAESDKCSPIDATTPVGVPKQLDRSNSNTSNHSGYGFDPLKYTHYNNNHFIKFNNEEDEVAL